MDREQHVVVKGRDVLKLLDDIRRAAEGQVEIPPLQRVLQAGGAVLDELQPDPGIIPAEGGEERREDIAVQEMRPPELQAPGTEAAEILDLAGQVLLEMPDVPDRVDVGPAGVGQRKRPAAPVEELRADIVLDALHRKAESGLAHV